MSRFLGTLDEAGDQARLFPWRLVAVASILCMEICLLVPWVRLFTFSSAPPGPGLLLLWFLALAWLARSTILVGERIGLPGNAITALSGVGLLVSILLAQNLFFRQENLLDLVGAMERTLPAMPQVLPPSPQLLVAMAAILVWRWGTAAASPTILEHGRTGFKFRVGVLVFAGLAIVTGAGGGPLVPALFPPFVLASLLAMTLTRAHGLSRQHGAGEPPFTQGWFFGLLVLLTATVLAGMALGWGLNTSIAHELLVGLRNALALLIYLLMLPILLALSPLINRLIRRLQRALEAVMAEDLPFQLEAPFQPGGEPPGPPALVETILDWLHGLEAAWPYLRAALASSLLGLLLYLTIRRAREGGLGEWKWHRAIDEGESLADRPAGRRLRGALAELGSNLRSLGRALLVGRLRTALVVRRVYARLLDLAAERGRARFQWETPLEFRGALAELFPGRAEEVDLITASYLEVRYGLFPESEDTVRRVRSAWRRIQAAVEERGSGEVRKGNE